MTAMSLITVALLLCTTVNIGEATLADRVCYSKYGCFSNKPPFFRLGIPLPQPPSDIATKFLLFTRTSPSTAKIIDDTDIIKYHASGYKAEKRTIFVVHGFTESGIKSPWVNAIRRDLLRKEDANVIAVDWEIGARGSVLVPNYLQATANTRIVGAQIAELIKFLNQKSGNTPASFYVIGFSLGAHVAGYAGRRTPGLSRITGLDPAGPYFTLAHNYLRLDASDANFVDVVHTDMYGLGTTIQSGHIDFYPNSGNNQRGCGKSKGLKHDIESKIIGAVKYVICDHMRAPDYYRESILSTCQLKAFPCDNWQDFVHGNCLRCGHAPCPKLGYNAIDSKGKSSGNFYLYTNEDKPFCVHKYYTVTFKTGRDFTPFTWFSEGYNPVVRFYGTKGESKVIELEKRTLKMGSTERFVVPVTLDLGRLTKIEVRHRGPPIDTWHLVKALVTDTATGKKFTGCFEKWITHHGASRNLRQGDLKC